MEIFVALVPVVASSVAILVSIISWRSSRNLQREKTFGDFEVQARMKQIEALLSSNGAEIVKINERLDNATSVVTKSIQDVQDFRNFLRRISAIILRGEYSDLSKLSTQLDSVVVKVEDAHKAVFALFLDTYDLSTTHDFKKNVQRSQPLVRDLLSGEYLDSSQDPHMLQILNDLIEFGKDAQSELRDVLRSHRTKLQLEIEHVKLASLA